MKRKLKFNPILDTSSGIPVRSKLERACVDWLMAHGFEFRYEPLILLGGRQFRPDFFLKEHNIFLEICGYNHMPHYRDRVAEKKNLYHKFGMDAIFIECQRKSDMVKALDTEFIKRGLVDDRQ